MVTAFYSIGKVTGAEIWVSGFFVCILFFAAVCLLFKANRTKKSIIAILLSLLVAEIICDITWFLIYFPGGSYTNYGMNGIVWLMLWPAILILAGVIGSVRNISRCKVKKIPI